MKKLLLLATLTMMAASPAKAQFFKKMKESWNNYQNEKSQGTSSYNSSSYNSSSQTGTNTRSSKRVDTSESAGQWVNFREYKGNTNQIGFTAYVPAIRCPKNAFANDIKVKDMTLGDILPITGERFWELAQRSGVAPDIREDGNWIVLAHPEGAFSPNNDVASMCQVFITNEKMKELEESRLPKEDTYKFLLDLWPVKNVKKQVFKKNVVIEYENGDILTIFVGSGGGTCWYGKVHLKGGNIVKCDKEDKKITMIYPDGKSFVGDYKEKEMYPGHAPYNVSLLANSTLTPNGGDWRMADGTVKHDETESERYFREQEEYAQAQRKAREQAKQKERQALYTKYGKKYVDALLDDGEILVGCPIGLLKEKCWIKLYSNSGTEQAYRLYSTVSNYSNSGIIGDKRTDWTHTIWVKNGRVTSITDYR